MNKNSKVLALKYRPQTFDDLIGQKIVSETIVNSIKANKVPNAYLFNGIRGIGKTTTARIVATILAVVVFPIPRIPLKRYAFGTLFALIEFTIVSDTIFWPIKSSNVCGLYFNARTLEFLFIIYP